MLFCVAPGMSNSGYTKKLLIRLFAVAAAIALAGCRSGPPRQPLLVGVDANYSLEMEQDGAVWKWDGRETDLFEGMEARGVGGFRVRLWTVDSGPHSRGYAGRVIRRAAAAGLEPYLVIFLSDDWADMLKQPLPAAWRGLSFAERKSAVEDYSREVVAYLRGRGLRGHLYAIGNEIDFGICGEYSDDEAERNPAALRERYWPRSAELIKASQAGVREADPEARFMLHISHWWDADFCEAFFRFMIGRGVRVDYAGLSYFPSSGIGGSLETAQFGELVSRLAAAIDRPVVVAETAYPAATDFTGQFSGWKHQAPGYPLTPEGQRRWLADFLSFCAGHPAIHSVYYWSPEWFGEGMWKAFALFDPEGEARPAWDAISDFSR